MILVTGGAGFIGSNFILDWFAQHGEPLVNLDKLTYAGNVRSLASLAGDERHAFVRGDIGDADAVGALLSEHRPRAIVNFAAETHVDRSIHGPAAFIDTNVVGTFSLLECVRGWWAALPARERDAFRFLHVSTDEVYGSLGPDDPAFSETTPFAPNSPYAASKASSDHVVRAYHHTYGLPTLTTNCSNNYGRRQCRNGQHRRRAHALRPRQCSEARARVRTADHVRDRQARARSPLRDRRLPDPARDRLDAVGDIQVGHGPHRRLVHDERRVATQRRDRRVPA